MSKITRVILSEVAFVLFIVLFAVIIHNWPVQFRQFLSGVGAYALGKFVNNFFYRIFKVER